MQTELPLGVEPGVQDCLDAIRDLKHKLLKLSDVQPPPPVRLATEQDTPPSTLAPSLDPNVALLSELWERGAAVVRSAPVGRERDLPARGFHLRLNNWELRALQVIADHDLTSKQKVARGAVREYIKKWLKKEGIVLPDGATTGTRTCAKGAK